MGKLGKYLISGAIVFSLVIGGIVGYNLYPTIKPCPNVTTDIITVVDTNWYHMSDSLKDVIKNLEGKVNYWKNHRDTIKLPGDTIPIPADVDTAAILRDYYSVYKYGWEKKDTNIHIIDSVLVTQNTPVWHKLSYQILRPQTVINNNVDNTVTYNSYLQFGLGIPVYRIGNDSSLFNDITNISLDLTYVFPKGYMGIGWQPETNAILAKFGATIIKFKKRR